jgi:hypothetical protein
MPEDLIPVNELKDYILSQPPREGPMIPQPFRNRDGRQIEWYWKDERCVAESIHANGFWVGTLLRSMKTGEVCGVKIFEEAIKGDPAP